MGEVARTTPAEARRKVTAGEALFVCAYESEELCGRMMLDGGMSLGQFRSRLATLDKGQEIIFYCA